jgi:hypothetical protein
MVTQGLHLGRVSIRGGNYASWYLSHVAPVMFGPSCYGEQQEIGVIVKLLID